MFACRPEGLHYLWLEALKGRCRWAIEPADEPGPARMPAPGSGVAEAAAIRACPNAALAYARGDCDASDGGNE